MAMAIYVTILLGKGDGTFAAGVNYTTGIGPVSVTTGDFNKDGKIDLAVLTNFIPGIAVLLGNGDGTFQSATSYSTPNYPFGLLAADFHGSNNIDLAVLAQVSNYDVNILAGDGHGHFAAPTPYYMGIGTVGMVAADFDKNGSIDLAVTNAIYQISAVTVVLNDAVAAISAGLLRFPKTAVGSTSKAKKVQFSNPGTAPVEISSINIAGADAGNFFETNSCGNRLAVGKSCTVTVEFLPTQKGKRSAVLSFNDTALSGSQTVLLMGTGQ
jgi:hypothetical protein